MRQETYVRKYEAYKAETDSKLRSAQRAELKRYWKDAVTKYLNAHPELTQGGMTVQDMQASWMTIEYKYNLNPSGKVLVWDSGYYEMGRSYSGSWQAEVAKKDLLTA